jgi:hypothetical protein
MGAQEVVAISSSQRKTTVISPMPWSTKSWPDEQEKVAWYFIGTKNSIQR